MPICTKCDTDKPLDDFGGWPRSKWCRPCAADYQRELRKRKPNYRGSGRNKALAALSQDERVLHNTMTLRLNDLKTRIRRYKVSGGYPDVAFLVQLWHNQQGICALTGLPMSLEVGAAHVVSIDKIIPELGYAEENIQLTSWSANRAKGDLDMATFVAMCKAVAGRCNDYPERE